ncbi:MAG: hypothetical protein L6R41_007921 [Letrouitia leprolyta]|nr:MAG: hypothetical protein L6R41_007921 [Letrouitia leprolyta]
MDLLASQLEQSGLKTCTYGLVSVNRPDLGVEDDTAALINNLQPLVIDEGKDIVLYLHSYAGFVGSAAIAGLSKSERLAKGEEGGIVGLIYQSAFIPIERDTLLGMLGGEFAPWLEVNHETGLAKPLSPIQTFYPDVPEDLARKASLDVLDHSLGIFHVPSGPVYYGTKHYDRRKVYIHTSKDETLPPFAQDLYTEKSGVEWDVKRIETGHSPFLSQPERLSEMVVDVVRGFVDTYRTDGEGLAV